jgi:urocanate hydratase
MATATRTTRGPRGTSLTCGGRWQDAALRTLMNTLDADIARRLDDLQADTRPFASLCQEADVFAAVRREGFRMPAGEARAC